MIENINTLQKISKIKVQRGKKAMFHCLIVNYLETYKKIYVPLIY